MWDWPEIYRRKAESFEEVAQRLKNRKDPRGRKEFASAQESARQFRNLAKLLAARQEPLSRAPNLRIDPAVPVGDGKSPIDLTL
jgi:hypothetical protein